MAEQWASLPVWERGLKWQSRTLNREPARVAPRVGAWIEMSLPSRAAARHIVAPRVGAWIEIRSDHRSCPYLTVAPRVGAWIEI